MIDIFHTFVESSGLGPHYIYIYLGPLGHWGIKSHGSPITHIHTTNDMETSSVQQAIGQDGS